MIAFPSILDVLTKRYKQHHRHQVFLSSGCTYSSDATFRSPFIVTQVREGTIVVFLRHLTDTLAAFAPNTPGSNSTSAGLVLVLARAAWDLHTSTAHYLVSHNIGQVSRLATW